MRRVRLVVIGIGALMLAGCPAPTAPRQIGVGGGGGGARLLVFLVQPSSANAGATITPAVQVAIEDTLGVIDTTATGGVTIALGANPSGGVLSGTTTVAFSAGVSIFNDLSVNTPGQNYTLTAASSGLTTITSVTFNIN